MSLVIKCKIEKSLFQNGDFRILSIRPLENLDQVKTTMYGNFTIKGEHKLIEVGKIYTLELGDYEKNKYGITYELLSVPSLDFSQINDDNEFDFLLMITSENLARNINDAYPDFLRRIINQRRDSIDLSKIKGVKEKKFEEMCAKIDEIKLFMVIISKCSKYKITQKEAQIILTHLDENTNINSVEDIMNENPYNFLINYAERSFIDADRIILEVDEEKYIESVERTEELIMWALNVNEYGDIGRGIISGNTWIDAVELAHLTYSIAPECLRLLKIVSIDSERIYYEESTNRIAKSRTYEMEKSIAEWLIELSKKENNDGYMEYERFNKIKDGLLTEEQMEFLRVCSNNRITVLNSGAGMGKSSCMMAMLDMLDEYEEPYQLLTFTGKASSRLSEQTNRKSSTIHRQTAYGFIYGKYVFIDEASMIGLDLILMVKEHMSEDQCLILIGDTSQIPSISKGNVFQDIVDSGICPVQKLTKVFRYKEGGASKIAEDARNGINYVSSSNDFIIGEKEDFKFIHAKNILEQVKDQYVQLLDMGYSKEDIVILTPINGREYGTININNEIQKIVNPIDIDKDVYLEYTKESQKIRFKKGDLVLITQNDRKIMTQEEYEGIEEDKKGVVYNGEVGKVVYVNSECLYVFINEQVVVYEKSNINKLLLAYCCTPFKYQGSESKCVIDITINDHSFMHNRNLMYTSLTRFREKLIQIAHVTAIENLLPKETNRLRRTFLKELLTNDNK